MFTPFYRRRYANGVNRVSISLDNNVEKESIDLDSLKDEEESLIQKQEWRGGSSQAYHTTFWLNVALLGLSTILLIISLSVYSSVTHVSTTRNSVIRKLSSSGQ
jgi:hypothetical protein